MRKWIIAITAMGLLLLTAVAAGAEGRRDSRWWNTPKYMEALRLTDGEIQQLNKAYEASSLEIIKLKGLVETARLKLEFMLEEKDLDESAIDTQYNRLEEARAVLGKERFAFYVRVRKIIGAQRFSELMEIVKDRHRSHK
jgi:Spy/CpxP family protein refolding chaperone